MQGIQATAKFQHLCWLWPSLEEDLGLGFDGRKNPNQGLLAKMGSKGWLKNRTWAGLIIQSAREAPQSRIT